MTPATRTDHASAIAGALDALEVRPPFGHSWIGDVELLPAVVVRLADETGVRRALVGSIRARLYESFFIHGTPRPATGRWPRADVMGGISHELSAANQSTGWLEPGWRVIGEEDDRWIVQRADLRLWVTADDLDADGRSPRIGDEVSVRQSGDLPVVSPGFYVARGDRGFPSQQPGAFDRVYFDLRREGAVPFIREVTGRLNDAGLGFVAKVVDDPDGFGRCDAGVLFFARRDRERALEAVDDLARELAPFLDGGTPAMTQPLRSGVGFAEDPGGSESFGSHRCLLIAEAAVTAAERGLERLDDRLDLVREHFLQAGTTLDAPYLGPPHDDPRGRTGELEPAGAT